MRTFFKRPGSLWSIAFRAWTPCPSCCSLVLGPVSWGFSGTGAAAASATDVSVDAPETTWLRANMWAKPFWWRGLLGVWPRLGQPQRPQLQRWPRPWLVARLRASEGKIKHPSFIRDPSPRRNYCMRSIGMHMPREKAKTTSNWINTNSAGVCS